jgi:hypothetical protein
MSEEQIALAKRAVECKGFRLMSGMRTHRGETIDCVDFESGQAYCGEFDVVISALPDLTDPATLGCLLALVREHHKEPRLAVIPNGKGWSVSRVWLRSPHDRVAGVHTLEAEALVAALEAAP